MLVGPHLARGDLESVVLSYFVSNPPTHLFMVGQVLRIVVERQALFLLVPPLNTNFGCLFEGIERILPGLNKLGLAELLRS